MKLYKIYQIEFILGVEETYEPPEDDDARKLLFYMFDDDTYIDCNLLFRKIII
jgi:hypothetical protein